MDLEDTPDVRIHVLPMDDEREHEVGECWCEPAVRVLEREDGVPARVFAHEALLKEEPCQAG